MTTSPGFHPSAPADQPFRVFCRSVNLYGGRVPEMFAELCIRQKATAPGIVAICFGTWQQTTFAERAVLAARTAAVASVRVISMGTATVAPRSGRTRSGLRRLLSRLGFRRE